MWVPLIVFFPPQTTLVIGLGIRPDIDVDNELLGPIPLQYLPLQYLINNTTNEFGDYVLLPRLSATQTPCLSVSC